MNYFERLVRRALMRPASEPGVEPADPFETVAEWPLEEPPMAEQKARGTIETVSPSPAADAARQDVEPPKAPMGVLPTAREREDATTVVAPVDNAPGAPGVLSLGVPIAPVHIVSAPARADVAASVPLDVADAFMRNLGVRFQAPSVEPHSGPATGRPPAGVLPEPGVKPIARTAPQAVVPPPPRPPEASSNPPSAIADAPSRLTSPRDAPARERQRRAPPPADRREVLVIERHASADLDRDRPAGRGSPRFGLGQL